MTTKTANCIFISPLEKNHSAAVRSSFHCDPEAEVEEVIMETKCFSQLVVQSSTPLYRSNLHSFDDASTALVNNESGFDDALNSNSLLFSSFSSTHTSPPQSFYSKLNELNFNSCLIDLNGLSEQRVDLALEAELEAEQRMRIGALVAERFEKAMRQRIDAAQLIKDSKRVQTSWPRQTHRTIFTSSRQGNTI